MFALELSRGNETRSVSVVYGSPNGWELTERADSRAVRTVRYPDWQRVERAIASIQLQAVRDGWRLITNV